MSICASRAQAVFLRVVESPSCDRAALLVAECGLDIELRHRVEALLAAHESDDSLLDCPPVTLTGPGETPTTEVSSCEPSPGETVGVYTLMQKLGEGGMGAVFAAEQHRPVRRRVALKLIKAGMDSAQVLHRFEAERQALALMDHTNIAKVFDAGSTPQGRPFFAMELVKGVPITKYCDDLNLPVRERLELFVPVCQAIQHAHLKGVIHRDVKPSNVLVCIQDGRPVPKVIDFGVAKALHERLVERTMYTEIGALIGTLEYMAPEQAELSALDVDTRVDVFALGALLYELLTGTTPIDRSRLASAGLAEMMRIIREEEPPKPSTRLSASKEGLTGVAVRRRSDPLRLRRDMRGDLDRIVMKCLEKDRTRRYETAEALARDVERHLADEPIDARDPSRGYRLQKFILRNRGTLAAAVVVTVALLSGTAIAGWQAVRATKAQQLAEERSKQIRREVETLNAANVLVAQGRHDRLKGRWDDAEANLSEAIALRPDQYAGWIERQELYTHLGLWDRASADLINAASIREPDTSFGWYLQALLLLEMGDESGYRVLRQSLQSRFGRNLNQLNQIDLVRTSVLASGPQNHSANISDVAQRLMTSRSHDDWFAAYLLGLAYFRASEYERAAELLQRSTDAGSPMAAMGYPALAMTRHHLGQAEAARSALKAAADTLDRYMQDSFSADSGEYWVTRDEAPPSFPIAWWDWLEYRHFFREAKLLIEASSLEDDGRLHVLRARAFAGLHQMAEADFEYTKALRLRPDDPQILFEVCRDRGATFCESRRFREAAAEFIRATELRPDDVHLWRFRALAHFAAGDRAAYRADCAALLDRFGATDVPVVACNVTYVCTLSEGAVKDLDGLLHMAEVASPQWHFGTWVRGAALYRTGRYEEATDWFEAAARRYPPRAWDWAFLAMARHRLGDTGEARRCLAEGYRWISEANRRETSDRRETGRDGAASDWAGYDERIIYPLVLREAEELLRTRTPD